MSGDKTVKVNTIYTRLRECIYIIHADQAKAQGQVGVDDCVGPVKDPGSAMREECSHHTILVDAITVFRGADLHPPREW